MAEQRGRVRVEETHKRIRAQIGGRFLADSTDVKMVWEKPYFPTYYFPVADVRMDLLVPTGETHRSPSRGTAEVHSVKTPGRESADAARLWLGAEIEAIQDHVSIDWASMDHWYEEDEEVFVHARDPSTRIDILQSSRHVEVVVDGVKVADTTNPRLLFETGLPVRYYIPKVDVAMEYLARTDSQTHCPYKGTAGYWSVTVNGETHDDLVWGYSAPLQESQGIAGYVSFYNEKVDIYVDGNLEETPRTIFS